MANTNYIDPIPPASLPESDEIPGLPDHLRASLQASLQARAGVQPAPVPVGPPSPPPTTGDTDAGVGGPYVLPSASPPAGPVNPLPDNTLPPMLEPGVLTREGPVLPGMGKSAPTPFNVPLPNPNSYGETPRDFYERQRAAEQSRIQKELESQGYDVQPDWLPGEGVVLRGTRLNPSGGEPEKVYRTLPQPGARVPFSGEGDVSPAARRTPTFEPIGQMEIGRAHV